MKLNQISDKAGARKSRVRVGRGIGSGKGKTAARGVKGQKSRSGVAIKGFEGGQMPIHMRLPKRGFNARVDNDYAVVNLGRIQEAVDAGKLDANATVNGDSLVAAGVVRRVKDGIRVLARGELKAKLSFEVAGASKSAQEAIEKAGGSLTVVEASKREQKEGEKGPRARKRAARKSAS